MSSRLLCRSQFSKLTPSRIFYNNKRYASTENAKHAGETFKEETFDNKVWRNTLIVAVGAIVWYRIDERLTDQGDEKHPITRWIEYHMTQSQEKDQIAAEFLENSNRLAEYRLLYQEAQRPPIYRMRYPEAFERRSPRALVTGNNCDISDVNIRKD